VKERRISSLFRVKIQKLDNTDKIFQMKLRVDVGVKKNCLRKDAPDSPRRLLDCLQAYKDC
jgi:hypothetical protein